MGQILNSMKKFMLLMCFCIDCKWDWKVLGVDVDREQNCPECKSFNVFTRQKQTD
jgi:hypothetical protein